VTPCFFAGLWTRSVPTFPNLIEVDKTHPFSVLNELANSRLFVLYRFRPTLDSEKSQNGRSVCFYKQMNAGNGGALEVQVRFLCRTSRLKVAFQGPVDLAGHLW